MTSKRGIADRRTGSGDEGRNLLSPSGREPPKESRQRLRGENRQGPENRQGKKVEMEVGVEQQGIKRGAAPVQTQSR